MVPVKSIILYFVLKIFDLDGGVRFVDKKEFKGGLLIKY
jgi:hypothetical protein